MFLTSQTPEQSDCSIPGLLCLELGNTATVSISLRLRTFFLLVLLPLTTLAQSPNHQIQTEVELSSALSDVQRDQESKERLLKIHPNLVNTQLWSTLIDKASAAYYTQPPEQSIAIYEVAIQIATRLRDPKLLA